MEKKLFLVTFVFRAEPIEPIPPAAIPVRFPPQTETQMDQQLFWVEDDSNDFVSSCHKKAAAYFEKVVKQDFPRAELITVGAKIAIE